MRASLTRAVIVVLAGASLLSAPALAEAQRRGGGGHGRPGPRGGGATRVVVARGGLGWGGSLAWGAGSWWGGWGGWGPSPFGMFPYYDPAWYRSASMSSVRVQVQPLHTQVFVDGYFAGVADDFDGVFQRLRLDPGQHIVELYLPGHQPVRQDLLLTPGDGFRIRHVMQPLPFGAPDFPRPQPMFTPQPTAGPWGAAPQPPGFTPQAPAGPWSGGPQGQVTVGPPTPLPAPPMTPQAPVPMAPVPMAPLPPQAQGFGSLMVRAQPGDAEILIDGESWRGTGDALTVQLAIGRHRVEVRRQGFESFSTTVDVVPGQPAVLNVSLLRDDR